MFFTLFKKALFIASLSLNFLFTGKVQMRSIAKIVLCALPFMALAACENSSNTVLPKKEEVISGRYFPDETKSRLPLYRVKTPIGWESYHKPLDMPLDDTKEPLVEFIIPNSEGAIKITIHNFYYDSLQGRIPPEAQIARWKKQFASFEESSLSIRPQAFSGFVGLQIDCCGLYEGKNRRILAWSLQLAKEYWLSLENGSHLVDERKSDVTIKILGPENAINTFENELIDFARSFELIDPLPFPL